MAGKADREKLRTRVKAALEAQGRTQKQVEQALGWPAGSLTRVFAGKRTVDAEQLAALAAALDTDVASLATGTSLPGPAETPPVETAPAADAAPAPEPPPEPASAPEPVRVEPPRAEPPPAEPPPRREEKRRFRKRDIPLQVFRFLAGRILGG